MICPLYSNPRRSRPIFDVSPGSTAHRLENKKPTVGRFAEVGCLRCDRSCRYRAVPPQSGALLQQQQMQASILILWLTGHFLSYSGTEESQFTEVSAAG
jgi:hypothetical protein